MVCQQSRMVPIVFKAKDIRFLVAEFPKTFYLTNIIVPAEVVTAAKSVFIPTDKPEEVRFLPVNATAVRISWSGSVHLPTSIIYTVYCSTNVVRKNERVYPPGVTSVDIVLEDDIILTCTSYVHNFTLYYGAIPSHYYGDVIPSHYYGDVIPSPGNNPSTMTTFTFGKE